MLRGARGLSQSQLAQKMGVPRQHISRWEIDRVPTIRTLLRLSKALGVPVYVILSMAQTQKNPSTHTECANRGRRSEFMEQEFKLIHIRYA